MHHGEIPFLDFQPLRGRSSKGPQDYEEEKAARRIHDTLRQVKLGATGQFPGGKLMDSDKGEIQFALAADPESQKIVIDFGAPVAWIGCNREQAEDLRDALNQVIDRLRGIS
jgi:hypothetical protein